MKSNHKKYFSVSLTRAGVVIKEIEGIIIKRDGLKFWLFPSPSQFSKRQEVYVVFVNEDTCTVAYIIDPTEDELCDILILDVWFSPEDNLIFAARREKAEVIANILARSPHVRTGHFPRRRV